MSHHRTLVLFIAATVLFGTSFVGIKTAIESVPLVLFATFRVGVAAVTLLTLVAVRGGYWLPRTRTDTLGILTSTAFVLGANNVFLSLGQQYVTTGAAAVMYSIMPVASPVFAVLLLDDARISAADAAGILLGLVDVVVIVGPESVLSGESVGQALIVCSALSVAPRTMLLKRVGPSIGTPPQTTWAMTAAAIGIHAASLGLGESIAQVAWSPELVAAILCVGMPMIAAVYPVYSTLLSEAGPVCGDPITYAMPVVATVTGWMFLGEAASPMTVLDFGVILSGFLLVQRESVAWFVGLRGNVPAEAE